MPYDLAQLYDATAAAFARVMAGQLTPPDLKKRTHGVHLVAAYERYRPRGRQCRWAGQGARSPSAPG